MTRLFLIAVLALPASAGAAQRSQSHAAVVAPPAMAPGPESHRDESAAPSAAASRVADLLASREIVLAATSRILRQQLPGVLNADPDIQMLEKHWPGVTAEMIAAMEPIILSHLAERLPEYQRGVANIFDRHMSADELATTASFYGSPAGVHLLALVRDGIDLSAMLRQGLDAKRDARITGADLSSAIAPAVQPAMSALTDAEQLRLMSFRMTSAGRKMAEVDSDLLAFAARFNSDRDAAIQAKLAAAARAVVGRRTGAGQRGS